MQAMILILLMIIGLPAFSQTEQFPSVDFELKAATFNCELASMVAGELSSSSHEQINQLIQSSEKVIKQNISIHKDEKILKEILSILEELKRRENETKFQQFREEFCLKGSHFLKKFSQKIISGSVNLNMSLALPIRWVAQFLKGLKTGESKGLENLKAQDIIGDRRAISFSIYLLIKSFKVYSSGTPWLAPLMAAPLIQSSAIKFCQDNASLSTSEEEFCKKIDNKIKNFLHLSESARSVGAQLRKKEAPQEIKWEGEVTDNNLCSFLVVLKSSKKNIDKDKMTREALIGNLNPDLMAFPEFNEVESKNKFISSENVSQVMGLRNVIISLAPHPEVVDRIMNSPRWDEYLKIKKQLGLQAKIYNKLYRSGDIEKCEEIKTKKNFKLATYNSLKIKINNYGEESLIEQHQLVERQYKKNKSFLNFNKTHLDWELIPYGSLATVNEILRSRDIGNVIIIAHSSNELKKIVDVNMNQYPSTFFSDISPSLMSLSFYTCHSKNILSTYDLSNKFQNNLSYYPKRYINFVKPNQILEDGETPLMGFSSYLTRLDNELYLGMKENILSMTFASGIQESNPQKTCEIELTTSIPQTGSLSLILNKKFIGNINSLDKKTSFAFNCDFLKDKNVLTLQNNSVTEKLQVETLPSEIIINGLQTEILKWKNYFDEKNSFEGSKIEFIL